MFKVLIKELVFIVLKIFRIFKMDLKGEWDSLTFFDAINILCEVYTFPFSGMFRESS